jgi:hypothetical protein
VIVREQAGIHVLMDYFSLLCAAPGFIAGLYVRHLLRRSGTLFIIRLRPLQPQRVIAPVCAAVLN